ncbi:hypothetical protein NDU88_007188 [Pleurodeles waltl]|uniref:Uncharacterized protein n=1 Tax=Pleurodeles waltl TaxID=8319 RepID=A0AAV7RS89_PLEWA|nr:hypothetical protein NDU88_007188 [Pleurodeles waltl]
MRVRKSSLKGPCGPAPPVSPQRVPRMQARESKCIERRKAACTRQSSGKRDGHVRWAVKEKSGKNVTRGKDKEQLGRRQALEDSSITSKK